MALSGMGLVARHPKYLLEELTVSEFEDWKAFYYAHPFGEDKLLWMLAEARSDWINAHTPEHAERTDPKDLMPISTVEQRWEQIEAEIEAAQEERKEQQRLARMSPEQRQLEEERQFMARFNARMGHEAAE